MAKNNLTFRFNTVSEKEFSKLNLYFISVITLSIHCGFHNYTYQGCLMNTQITEKIYIHMIEMNKITFLKLHVSMRK